MSKTNPVQLPGGYEGYSRAPKESPLAMATRGAVLRALRGTAVPDFAAGIPPDFSSSNFDVQSSEAQALARSLWRDFLAYAELRRVEGKGTLELSNEGRGPYPLCLAKGQPVGLDDVRKLRNARIFAITDSLLQKNHEPSPDDLHAEMLGMLATETIGQELSPTEQAAVFLLAFAYPGSQARGVIDEHRRRSGDKGEPPRPKTPPPAHEGEGVAIAA